MVNTGILW